MANRRKKKERQRQEAQRHELEAKQKKRAKLAGRIILAVLVIFDLVLAGVGINCLKKEYELRKKCTAQAEGYVTDVKTSGRIHRTRRGWTDYISTYYVYIEVNDSKCPVHDIYLETGGFKKGDSATVYYDPDGYDYYVEGTSADLIILGILPTAFGAVMLLFKGWLVYIMRDKKKPENKKDKQFL